MNVADYYIKGTEQVGSWRDMHCRIEGGAVNELQKIFVSTWEKTTGEELTDPKYFQASAPISAIGLKKDTTLTAGRKTVAIINREPRKTNDIMRYFYINAIDDARDSIKIINPYFTLTRSIKKAIQRAIDRGVKVEIMLSAKSDIPLTPDCALHQAHKLMKRGAHVWLYQPGFHHSKIMMVDGRFCTIGSTNLNSRSLRFDYEDNAIILSRQTTAQLDSMFNADKQKSVMMTPRWWKEERSSWKKFVGWFAHLLSFTL